MLRVARLALAVLISACALIGAVRLVAPADGDTGVRRQLVFLRHELESGAAEDAQAQFPEGYFFLYALYGLTAVDLRRLDDARWALARLESDAGRVLFGGVFVFRFGVFFCGF